MNLKNIAFKPIKWREPRNRTTIGVLDKLHGVEINDWTGNPSLYKDGNPIQYFARLGADKREMGSGWTDTVEKAKVEAEAMWQREFISRFFDEQLPDDYQKGEEFIAQRDGYVVNTKASFRKGDTISVTYWFPDSDIMHFAISGNSTHFYTTKETFKQLISQKVFQIK